MDRSEPRYAGVRHAKARGVTYTPPELAAFLADRVADEVARLHPVGRPLACFDPAAGEGELLVQLAIALRRRGFGRLRLAGRELDPDAAALAADRLGPLGDVDLRAGDFLAEGPLGDVDVLVANPPWVRTQILGGARARRLADDHALAGRVDLYHAFLARFARDLPAGAVAGVLTSNRYLATRGGAAVRALLADAFEVRHVWDLGDTRLFDAAVLPALTVLVRRSGAAPEASRMTTIYEETDPAAVPVASVVAALAADGPVTVPDGRTFRVRHGTLARDGGDDGVWRLDDAETRLWLATVAAHSWRTFGDLGRLRVGIKTTADDVFVRADWDLPTGRPELLRPLVTHHVARRWRARAPEREVLYPHDVVDGRRVAVDLAEAPAARAWLEGHRERLGSRAYLRDAGRAWYELWVPHDPRGWSRDKLVWRDIAERPQFWLEPAEVVVNGDCYWMALDDGVDPDALLLALGVANTRFAAEFYDRRFHVKLYAGRRRFLTQFVAAFPLPDPALPVSQRIVALVRRAIGIAEDPVEVACVEAELEAAVREAFGVR